MTVREITDTPAGWRMLLRAGLPSIPVVRSLPGVAKTGTSLPDLTLLRRGVTLDPDHVTAYGRVCGFLRRETVPVTYPHLLGFGLQMALMSDPSFPHTPVGSVHLRNTITTHRPIGLSETLEVRVHATNQRPHPKGVVYDVVTSISAEEGPDESAVWEETSTYLRPGNRHPDAEQVTGPLDVLPTGIEWRLPADLGRSYASVSGDHNPIHLTALTAKAFGFPRQIAHGMWSKARCLAALDGRVPEAARIDVVFKKPILLPATVGFGSVIEGSTIGFGLTSPSGKAHLAGTVEPVA